MNISKKILDRDPSRFVVYEMLNDVKEQTGLEPVSLETEKMFLFKTVPHTNSLYNYAHIFSGTLDEVDWKIIEEFFCENSFRVKLEENKENEDFLLNHGLRYKSVDYSMGISDLPAEDLSVVLPADCEIKASHEPGVLDDFKKIFCSAFSHPAIDYEKKFGFLDSYMIDESYDKIKAFVLYAEDRPVSAGSYYSFSNFSLENIGTFPEERGKGYAGLIVSYLLNQARVLGCHKACLVSSENGINVYKKLGFKEIIKEVTYIKD